MAQPICPTGYKCAFTPPDPPPNYDVWWQGPAGVVVALITVVAVCALIAYIVYLLHERSEAKQRRLDREKQRAYELAVEEQRTMQIDGAKGNPEMLTLVKNLQSRW
jgi:phosphate/sulfate permease